MKRISFLTVTLFGAFALVLAAMATAPANAQSSACNPSTQTCL